MGSIWIAIVLGLLAAGMSWMAVTLRQLRARLLRSELELRQYVHEQVRAQKQAEVKLDLFVRSVESAEAGTRALMSWSQTLAEHATSIVFDEQGQGFRESPEALAGLRERSEQAGLFLPPELDRPYQRALKAAIGVQIAADAATKKGDRGARRELCRPAVVAMDQEILIFLNTLRAWKKRQWFQVSTGEEAAAETFNDVTNAQLLRGDSRLEKDDVSVGK